MSTDVLPVGRYGAGRGAFFLNCCRVADSISDTLSERSSSEVRFVLPSHRLAINASSRVCHGSGLDTLSAEKGRIERQTTKCQELRE